MNTNQVAKLIQDNVSLLSSCQLELCNKKLASIKLNLAEMLTCNRREHVAFLSNNTDDLKCEVVGIVDEAKATLSITMVNELESIIEGETSLKLSNMCKIHNVALKNNLDTRCDFKSCSLHIVNSDGLELVSFYTGFTRLVMEY